jgi:DNA (cytosine-5)-methyltransferase 1
MPFPVVDLFAGPGGLGEGFSALRRGGDRVFKIAVSIEKDSIAHQTLELRAFYRQFPDGEAPEEYYEYLADILDRDELFKKYKEQAERASHEAWNAELGGKKFPPETIDARIRDSLENRADWVLIGGPPCQAYSLVGRSRVIGGAGLEKYEADPRHKLYKHYLRIIARHRPPVFVMENVKGLLSARVQEKGVFEKILEDLQNPLDAVYGTRREPGQQELSYRLFSLVVPSNDPKAKVAPKDFVVKAEDYGVPQARHRIILLGVRADKHVQPRLLQKQSSVHVEDVISDLPYVRSGLSKEKDSVTLWREAILEIAHATWFEDAHISVELRREMRALFLQVREDLDRGGECIKPARRVLHAHQEWFSDPRLGAICNHSTRSHIRADIHRYFFVSAFARIHGRSPVLKDFPPALLPLHENVQAALLETKFNDRFRVQLEGRPSTTVTSHISKDGHYFIHYDPAQCRSLTVREAARLQTFPDNYFFEGPRTQQYHQVGNAVPPYLAHQIAGIVSELLA